MEGWENVHAYERDYAYEEDKRIQDGERGVQGNKTKPRIPVLAACMHEWRSRTSH